jgi:hypothetical protein
VGGILVGGTCGIFGEASENLVAAFIVGVIFVGLPPNLAGLGLAIGRLLDVIWRIRHESSVPIE